MQPIAARLADNRRWREKSAFQKQRVGRVRDRGIHTAHDPGQRQRPVVIGNHQRIITQFDLLTIQQGQFFAL